MARPQTGEDERFMQLALAEAAKGRGRVSPNPLVGCVLVAGGRVLACGYHHQVGQAHAEIDALRQVGMRAPGATAYVTLEPCNHFGRTPPCTVALIEAGVRRVVAAVEDPNPLVAGAGLARLRQAGLRVDVGVCSSEAVRLNEVYLHFMQRGRPFVAAKIAESLDGAIATASGHARWITGEPARLYAHRLRDSYDAILVGAGTVRADDPRLTTRVPGGRNPERVVVSSQARVPPTARVFSSRAPGGRILAVTRAASARRLRLFARRDVEVLICRSRGGLVDLEHLLELLAAREITSVLVEGGSALHGACFDARLVDKLYAFIAPLVVGGRGALRPIGGQGARRLERAVALDDLNITAVGHDLLVTGYPRYPR